MALLSTCNVIAGYGLKPARGGIRLQLNVVLNADEVIKGPDTTSLVLVFRPKSGLGYTPASLQSPRLLSTFLAQVM